MIAHFCAKHGGLVVYPTDEDGCDKESAIVVTLDADSILCLTQRRQSICIPPECAGELLRAMKDMLKEVE